MKKQVKPMENRFIYVKSIYEKTGCRSMTSGEVYNLITGGSLRQQTEYIRQLQAGENKKEEVDAAKRKLGGILPHAVFSGGRVGQNAESHTGCLMFDIDHCKTPAREVVRRASQLPYVLLATVSVRGEGVHVIVRADVCLANHTEVYKHVAKIITAALGEEIDPACKDLSRVMFLSHDAEAYYNPNASILHLPHTLTKEQKNNSSDNRTLTTDISRYLDAASITMTSGSRHTQLTSLVGCLVNAGFDMDDAISECVRRYAEPDFGEKEIESAIRGIYNKGRADFGKNRKDLARKEYNKTAETAKTANTSRNGNNTGDDEVKEVDIEESELFLETFPKSVYEELPGSVKKLLPQRASPALDDISLLTVFTLLGSVMPDVYGVMRDSVYYPTLYVSIIGESASGKGSIASLHKIVEKYQAKIYDGSKREVDDYNSRLEDYECLRQQHRKQLIQNTSGTAKFTMQPPREVFQKELNLSGYVTSAKMEEMLSVNAPFTTLFFETELETVIKLNSSEYGMYNDTINKTFHHETLSNHTITRGNQIVKEPKMSFVVTGTPGMLRKFVPDVENGTYPRLLVYRLRQADHYIPLTDDDDRHDIVESMDSRADLVLSIAEFLAKSRTRVRFTPRQRAILNAFGSKEYTKNIAFDHSGRNSTMLRAQVSLFRMCMILTAIRKYEAGWEMNELCVDDRDFETALSITKVCLRHSYFVATSLPRADEALRYTLPDDLLGVFVKLPVSFTCKEALDKAAAEGISASRIEKMLRRCQKHRLIDRVSHGCYQKTDMGKELVVPKSAV